MTEIRTKRVYDPVGPRDGFRVLVDRIWPRGLTKAQVRADWWLKELAPSTTLRQWFGHDSAKWEAFKRRYFSELDAKLEIVAELIEKTKEGPLTLLFSARDVNHNQAVALCEYLHAHTKENIHKEYNMQIEQLAQALRAACMQAAIRAYEEAGIQGLCYEGRWEAAVSAMESLDLHKIIQQLEQTSQQA